MSVEQLEQTILRLSLDERRRFLDWLYEHEEELRGPDYIHPDVKAEILRRREAALGNPHQLESWDGTTDRVRSRLHEIRDQKTKGS